MEHYNYAVYLIWLNGKISSTAEKLNQQDWLELNFYLDTTYTISTLIIDHSSETSKMHFFLYFYRYKLYVTQIRHPCAQIKSLSLSLSLSFPVPILTLSLPVCNASCPSFPRHLSTASGGMWCKPISSHTKSTLLNLSWVFHYSMQPRLNPAIGADGPGDQTSGRGHT